MCLHLVSRVGGYFQALIHTEKQCFVLDLQINPHRPRAVGVWGATRRYPGASGPGDSFPLPPPPPLRPPLFGRGCISFCVHVVWYLFLEWGNKPPQPPRRYPACLGFGADALPSASARMDCKALDSIFSSRTCRISVQGLVPQALKPKSTFAPTLSGLGLPRLWPRPRWVAYCSNCSTYVIYTYKTKIGTWRSKTIICTCEV